MACFKVVILLMVYSFLWSCKVSKYQKSQLYELKDYGNNEGNLNAYYFTPSQLSQNMPLVVVLHGCSQNALQAAELTGWNELAEKHGFCVLYPEQKRANNPSKCFNWFLSEDIEKDKGECSSIMAMTEEMMKRLPIDSSKIIVTGMSAGAAMSVVMASCYPDKFLGAAIMSGGPYKGAVGLTESVKAMRGKVIKSKEDWGELIKAQNIEYTGEYPKMMIIHGKDDRVVDFENSNQLTTQWSHVMKLDSQEVKVEKISSEIAELNFLNKKGEIVIKKLEVDNLGHQLLVDPGEGETQGGKTGVFGVDKDYFSSYWVLKYFILE